jgi:hypothetical protein
MSVESDRTWLAGFLTGPLIVGIVALGISWKAAWIGMVCHFFIGTFLTLVALGYDKPQLARGTLWGFACALALAAHPLWLTFG